VGEILRNLTLGADVAQQLDNGVAGGGVLGISSTGVVTALQQGHGRGLERGASCGRREPRSSDGVRCGERSEGLGSGSSPHSGAKGEHFANQHAAASSG
jgi:hypothetical protein